MKVKILKKSIKEGDNYCIKSLFVSFDSKDTYDRIVSHLKSQGVEEDKINSFCKPNDYNGIITYAFGLNCSHFTFDRVERFGILDANVVFVKNEKGYANAKIQIIDKKEQINGYEEPEDTVNGWSTPTPEIKVQQPLGDGSHAEPNPVEMVGVDAKPADPFEGSDLPF